jgi:hypothetical protein
VNFKFVEKIIFTVVIALAIFFRTNQLEGKLTFEWDQSRDYAAAQQIVKSGHVPLLGPIVRGDIGGFYLGPLYYYMVTPLYYFTNGNPLSLAIISIGMDLLVIFFLYAFLRKRLSMTATALAILIWACSPLIIRDSYTPWNVSLISLWTILFITMITRIKESGRFRYKFATMFLASLTLNIHMSLIPVVALTLLMNIQYFIKLNLKQYLYLMVALLIPISTLIAHDLTHNLENLRLFKQFMLTVTDKSGGIIPITSLVLEKFDYTIARLFTGEPYTYLGVVIVLIISSYSLLRKSKPAFVSLSLLSIVAVIGSLIYYHDFDFAEYYFMPTYIPIILLSALFLDGVMKVKQYLLIPLISVALTATYLYLGNQVRQEPISPYSLTIKRSVVQTIKDLGYPVEVRTSLPRERNTAFPYLMQSAGVTSEVGAARKAYIYESKNLEVVSPPEARSIILDQPIEAFKLIIFSN